jgi:predicted dehydrogenase
MKKIPRRKFLQYGGIAVSAAAMGKVYGSPARKISANDTIALGIIGTGSRGSGIAAELQQVPDFKLMACCDILPDHLEKGLSYASKEAKGYEDYRRLLDDPSLDAVVISTPLYLHHPMVVDAISAGKHIYCEKTMAYNYEQALDTAEKAQEYKGVFQVGHQYRNFSLYHAVKEIISQGVIGKVSKYTCQYHRNNDWRRPVSDPKLERLINWRMYREYSGGLTAELSSHQMDIVNWMTGSPPLKVTGFGGIDYWKDGREVNDNINLVYEYPDGAKANFTSILSNAFDGYKILILGDKGTIVIGRDKAWMHAEAAHLQADAGEAAHGIVDGVTGATIKNWTQGKPVEIEFDDQGLSPTVHAFLGFADCIRNGKRPFSNEETGLQAALAVHMGNEAMDKEKVIHWKDRSKGKD